ncbi:MAG: hypothetical protein JWQ25_2804, partial [Daejeonella sp.]|nr:hypothetical protein [Daejeonella sp.]
MKNNFLTCGLVFITAIAAQAQVKIDSSKLTEVWNPVPKIITPGTTAASAPSDAIVLFDGKNASAWKGDDGK